MTPADTTDTAAVEPDASTGAVEAARAALVAQVGADVVGEHLGAHREDFPEVATHRFASKERGYHGWSWAVTVAAPADQAEVTVDEIVLLPDDDAIVAPAWVPWRERIRPGDMSPGDLLPTDEDDARLVPTWLAGDEPDPVAEATVREVGLGRPRVLSLEGRDGVVQRWYTGDAGPDVPLAQSAPARCGGCGFLVRLAGPLSTVFGVCANEHANDDGRVVSLDHGCGAHSEAQLRKKQLPPPLPDPVYDTVSEDELETF